MVFAKRYCGWIVFSLKKKQIMSIYFVKLINFGAAKY